MTKRIASMLKIKFKNLFTRNKSLETQELEQSVLREFENLSKLEEKDMTKKNKEIIKMIGYYNDLTDSIEERRNKIYDSSLQYIAVLLTASGLLFTVKNSLGLWFCLIISLLGIQLLFTLCIIVTYELQSKYRYPFLKLENVGNRWKWFYYGNKEILKLNRNVYFPSKKFMNTTKPYLEGLKTFVENYTKEVLIDEISDNIKQLYLLQVHNYYKNKFYLSLISIRTVSVFVSLGWLIGYLYLLLM